MQAGADWEFRAVQISQKWPFICLFHSVLWATGPEMTPKTGGPCGNSHNATVASPPLHAGMDWKFFSDKIKFLYNLGL